MIDRCPECCDLLSIQLALILNQTSICKRCDGLGYIQLNNKESIKNENI